MVQADKRFLHIAFWNANGIKDKLFMLYDYLLENHIDVACVCETFLKSSEILNRHPQFDIHRNDRADERRKGGVMIFVRKNLKYRLLPYLHTQLIENIGIEVVTRKGNLHIYSCYVPGGAQVQDIRAHLSRDISALTRRQTTFFALGDFNAKHRQWNNSRANPAGTIIHDLMQRNGFYVLHPPSHTHHPSDPRKNPSTFDIGLTNSLLTVSVPRDDPLSSDHNLVSFTVQLEEEVEIEPNYLRYCFKNANWDNYRSFIDEELEDLNMNHHQFTTTNQVDELVSKLTDVIQRAKQATVPRTLPDQYGLILTPAIKEKMRLCKRIQRQYQRAQNISRKTELKQLANRLHKEICRDIDHLRNVNWSFKLQDLPTDGDRVKLFDLAKFIRRRAKHLPPLKVDDNVLITPQEKADQLALNFAEAHANPLAADDPDFTAIIEARANQLLNEPTDLAATRLPNISATDQIIKRLKTRKAPGLDHVNNILLKNLPRSGVLLLHIIILCCIKLCYFPLGWKTGIVTALPKPGKPTHDPRSYRPISLLSSLSKILEKHVLELINEHLKTRPIIPDDQFGFVRGRSSVGQLLRVKDHIKAQLDDGSSTGMMLLDVERAFDRVWHAGLLHKMHIFDFPLPVIKMIGSFLSNRSFHVKVGTAMSPQHTIPFGVPQGAILSPSLYNIYTSDAPDPSPCSRGLFADDTAFFISSKLRAPIVRGLRQTLLSYVAYFKKWKTTLNIDKTQLIFFTKRLTREVPKRPFKAGTMTIRWSDEAKYLGVTFDKRLTFRRHVENVVNKTNVVIKILYPLVARRSSLHQSLKLHVYKSIIRPSFSYGCQMLGGIAATHINKLQVLQNGALKMILSLPSRTRTSEVHEQAEVERVQEHFDNLATRWRSSHTESELVRL